MPSNMHKSANARCAFLKDSPIHRLTRSPIHPFFMVLGLCCLSGCAVGPDYAPSRLQVPDRWEGTAQLTPSSSSKAASDPVTLISWWESFNDDTLTSLVRRAIQSNLDLRQAASRIRQARAERGVGSAALWPTLDASAAYRRIGSGGSSSVSGASDGVTNTGNTLPSGGGTDRNLFQAGLDAAWELDVFGGNRRNVEALTADEQAAVEDLRDVLVTLASEVAINFIELRRLQQQILIAQENLRSQQKTAGITRMRYEAGFVSALDTANAEAQVATTASQIPLLQASAREAVYNLGVLLGQEPTALIEELEPTGPIPLIPPEIPVGLPSDLLRRRPDIRRMEARVHAATARIGVATADLYPSFSLTGSLSFSGDDLGSLSKWSSRAWSVGPSVQWPIFNAGRIRWNIEVQKALQEQTLLECEKTVLTALKDVETALTAHAREQEHLLLLEEAVEQNRRAVSLSTQLYTAGQTDFLDVLLAQRSLFISEEALVQSRRNLALDLVALYKALGGGWEETEE